jgi:hypothetical protein
MGLLNGFIHLGSSFIEEGGAREMLAELKIDKMRASSSTSFTHYGNKLPGWENPRGRLTGLNSPSIAFG